VESNDAVPAEAETFPYTARRAITSFTGTEITHPYSVKGVCTIKHDDLVMRLAFLSGE
jgi:hypothetical protein